MSRLLQKRMSIARGLSDVQLLCHGAPRDRLTSPVDLKTTRETIHSILLVPDLGTTPRGLACPSVQDADII